MKEMIGKRSKFSGGSNNSLRWS